MDIGKLTGMAEGLFQGKDQVSKQEIQSKAQSSNLGSDEKSVVDRLPDKMFSKNELMQKITEMATQKAGVGSMFGGG